jgi:hypothetical protein
MRQIVAGLPSMRQAVAGLGLLAVLALASCTGDPKPPPHPPVPPSASVATNTGPFQAGPVAPPASGALLGAWVRPTTLSQPDRLAAVGSFEATLGRPLDIVNTYRRFTESFPTRSDRGFAASGATLMLSWAIDDTRVITSGAQDAAIHDWAHRIRDFGSPILLRFRWEMDRPNLSAAMWSAPDYIAAWKHVREIFTTERVPNVSWVWCPTAEGFAGGYAPPFYPGDDQVDWTCVDVYAGNQLRPLGELLHPFLTWAAAHPKPIVIGEFGVARAWGAARAGWLADAAAVFRANPQIKAVTYFNSDPDGNGPKQQFQLSNDPNALAAFTSLARQPYFHHPH